MIATVIAAVGPDVVRRLRRTFPASPWTPDHDRVSRRGRILVAGHRAVVELPTSADATAELAFALGLTPRCRAVLLVNRGTAPETGPRQAAVTLADRVTAPGRREYVPDILAVPTAEPGDLVLGELSDPVVWSAWDWTVRRWGPHQVWAVALQPPDSDPEPAAQHRGLRAVVAALEEQTA